MMTRQDMRREQSQPPWSVIFPQGHWESSFGIFEILNDSELIQSNGRLFSQRAFPGMPKAGGNMIVRPLTFGNL
jgi:hypothetical protein